MLWGRGRVPSESRPNETAELVERAAVEIVARYVFPAPAQQAADAIRRVVRSGGYDALDGAALAGRLTADLQAETGDLHLRVFFHPDGIPSGSAAIDASPGIARAAILPGNIGYLAPDRFAPVETFAPEADAAMGTLADTRALIIDLRSAKGGSPASVGYLCSFFFAPECPVHLNTLHWRDAPSEESWTRPVPLFYRQPVYVLTSRTTFSGAEECANDLKLLRRATLVGETTRGGAHPGRRFPLDARFEIFIPVGRAENPVTKSNWEGVGVAPDVALPAAAATAKASAASAEMDRISV